MARSSRGWARAQRLHTSERMKLYPSARRWTMALALGLLLLAVSGLLLDFVKVLLLTFAGILGGILLDALTGVVARRTKLPRRVSLGVVLVLLIGTSVGVGWIVGPPLYDQFVHMSEALPPAAMRMGEDVAASRLGQKIVGALPSTGEVLTNGSLVDGVALAFTSMLGGLAAGFFALVVALFSAAAPHAYLDPAIRLIPPAHRDEARRLLDLTGENLRHWLVARFISMAVVGVMTGLLLWAVGVPAAASLGLLAGLLSFIPNLGPILASLPGILLGFAEEPMLAVWAGLVYAGVQIIEGNFITPFVEQRALSLPAALLLSVQLLLGVLTGIIGLLVATPLLVVVVLAVRELYVRKMEAREGEAEGLSVTAAYRRCVPSGND